MYPPYIQGREEDTRTTRDGEFAVEKSEQTNLLNYPLSSLLPLHHYLPQSKLLCFVNSSQLFMFSKRCKSFLLCSLL